MPGLSVLLVSPLPPPPGGIATWTRILLRELERRGSVQVLHLDTAVRWRGVTQLSAPVRLTGGAVQAIRDVVRFRSFLARGAPDVVHVCTSAGPALVRDLWMLRLSQARRVPAVIHYRMGRIPRLREAENREWTLLRRCTEAAARTLVLDRRSERVLQGACPGADVRTMPNMVDVEAVEAALAAMPIEAVGPGRSAEIPVVAYAGHVLPSKGVSDLVKACVLAEVAVELRMAGPVEAGYRRELEAMAQGGVRLEFRGTLSYEDTMRMIAGADVFALPSHSEGFPNVVAEAMACGRAVLGTDVGAIRDMLEVDGSDPCGICVPARDVDALARAIARLTTDACLRERMGTEGRRRARTEYAAPVVTHRLVELWGELAQ